MITKTSPSDEEVDFGGTTAKEGERIVLQGYIIGTINTMKKSEIRNDFVEEHSPDIRVDPVDTVHTSGKCDDICINTIRKRVQSAPVARL